MSLESDKMDKLDSERMDRMEHHMKLLKKDSEMQNKTLDSIESALIGNLFNGHKGLIHAVNEIDIRVKNLEEVNSVTKENMRQIKLFAGGAGTLVLGYILWILTN